jgi:type IV secretory pathway TrbD component
MFVVASRWWRVALAGLAASLPAASPAGLDIASMQQRDRALPTRTEGLADHPTGLAVDEAPTSLTLQLGARPGDAPPLVGGAVSGGSALRLVHCLTCGDEDTARRLEVRLGASLRHADEKVRLEGSRVALRLGPGAAYASYEARHWGPGWFGSLILDGGAPPVPTIGWRGGAHYGAESSWGADVFIGPLAGHPVPGHPKLIGMRGEWRPNRAWAIGLSRTMQWGGVGRPEGLRSLYNLLISNDTLGKDGIDTRNEPGNQLGGLDVRYDRTLEGGVALGAYGQIVAEDKATTVPSRRLWLLGADGATTLGDGSSLRGIVEATETTAGKASGVAYRHHIYLTGYKQRGEVLGHPVGGDVRLASAGVLLDRGRLFAMAAVHVGRALKGAQLFTEGDRLIGMDAGLTLAARDDLSLGLSLHRWRASSTGSETWAQVWAEVRWP